MSDNKVVRWGFSAEIDPLGSYVTYHDYMMLKEDNDRLRAELANLQARDIHTCWAECPRPMCVMRRERDRAVAELAEAKAKRVPDAYEKAIAAALDFIGTVAPGASWWDDVWPEHEAAMLAAANKHGGEQ